MNKIYSLMLVTLLFLIACGKEKQESKFLEGSKTYELIKTVSDTFQISTINPAESNELIKTKNFSIYNEDIMPGMYRMLSPYAQNLKVIPKKDITDIIKQIAKQEAERKLLLAEAQNKNITISQDTIESRLDQIYTSNGGKEKFVTTITEQEFTIKMVEEDVKNSIIIQKYMDEYVYANIKVEENEILDSYEKNHKGPKTATVQHILMMTQGKTAEQKTEIATKMKDVLKQVRAGKDFGQLAKQYSEDPSSKDKGGLYEKFPRGQMVKPFEDASFNLPIGSISDLVETQYGYHIIKVVSREEETRTFDELREEIKTTLVNAKKNDVIIAHVEMLKKENNYQEIYPGL